MNTYLPLLPLLIFLLIGIFVYFRDNKPVKIQIQPNAYNISPQDLLKKIQKDTKEMNTFRDIFNVLLESYEKDEIFIISPECNRHDDDLCFQYGYPLQAGCYEISLFRQFNQLEQEGGYYQYIDIQLLYDTDLFKNLPYYESGKRFMTDEFKTLKNWRQRLTKDDIFNEIQNIKPVKIKISHIVV